jgi:purine-cytosine permease-like protein
MDSEVEGHAMTYRRSPHDQPLYVWSIDEQDTRVLRIGYGVVTVGVIVGACGVALMDTAFAAFGILIFLGLMIPCAAGVFVADHLANKPEDMTDDSTIDNETDGPVTER